MPRLNRASTAPPFVKSIRVPITADQYQMLKRVRAYSDVAVCELLRRDLVRHHAELVEPHLAPGGNGNGHPKGNGRRKAGV